MLVCGIFYMYKRCANILPALIAFMFLLYCRNTAIGVSVAIGCAAALICCHMNAKRRSNS